MQSTVAAPNPDVLHQVVRVAPLPVVGADAEHRVTAQAHIVEAALPNRDEAGVIECASALERNALDPDVAALLKGSAQPKRTDYLNCARSPRAHPCHCGETCAGGRLRRVLAQVTNVTGAGSFRVRPLEQNQFVARGHRVESARKRFPRRWLRAARVTVVSCRRDKESGSREGGSATEKRSPRGDELRGAAVRRTGILTSNVPRFATSGLLDDQPCVAPILFRYSTAGPTNGT